MGLYLGKEKINNVAPVITQNANSMTTEIQNHIADTNIHITADERTKWNAAAENSSSPTVMLNNIADPATDYDAANKHYVDSKALPTASTADNGKVLSVVNGAWAAAAMSSGAYVGSYTGTSTGTTPGDLSKTLTFNFKPALIIIQAFNPNSDEAISQAISQIVYGAPVFGDYEVASSTLYYADRYTCSWSNNSITMTAYHGDGSIKYINCKGYTYYYIAIPAMN